MSGLYTYTIPAYIDEAFIRVYAYPDQEVYEAFASRWGGLDRAIFERVAHEGEGDDQLVALFALDNLVMPETTDILASFLDSPQRLERAISATALAKRRDARALPVLHHLLGKEISFEEHLWASHLLVLPLRRARSRTRSFRRFHRFTRSGSASGSSQCCHDLSGDGDAQLSYGSIV